MAKYTVVGNNGVRTTSDPGKAKLIEGGGDKYLGTPGWADLAYTAGGGTLGYLLSKWIMGDDDDEDGKKKGGFFKSIIPWLAAAAGAYGGHYLSGSASKAPGESGEYAFKTDEDGNINIGKAPEKGRFEHRTGNVLAGAAAAQGARSAANWAQSRPQEIREGAAALLRDSGSHQDDFLEALRRRGKNFDPDKAVKGTLKPKTLERYNELLERAQRIKDSRVADRNWGWLRNGAHIGTVPGKGNAKLWARLARLAGGGWKTMLAQALALGGASAYMHNRGTNKDVNFHNWEDAVKKLKASGSIVGD